MVRRAGFGLVYFALASTTIALTRFDGGVAMLWVASAPLIAMLVTHSRRQWPSLMLAAGIGSVLATGLFGFGWALAPVFAAINLIEALIAAMLMRRTDPRSEPLDSLGWLGRFVLAVGFAGPLVAALMAGVIGWGLGRNGVETFVNFFLGHALGAVTFTPIAMQIARRRARPVRERPCLSGETPFHLALIAIVSLVVFSQGGLPLLFVPILPIILATFRVGSPAAVGGIVLLALIGGGLTLAGFGPVSMIDVEQGARLQFFQFFLAAVVMTVLPVAADLANRSRLHRELRFSEARHRLIAEHSTDIVMHIELDGRMRYVSPSIERVGGYRPEELVGRNANVLLNPDEVEKVRAAHMATIAAGGGAHAFEYRARTKSGEERWFETKSRAVVDQDGTIDGVLSFIRDVTARKAVELRLKAEAQTDALTGLPNRRAFGAIARTMTGLAEEMPTMLAILDIDHFKQVNDRFGHDAGDAVLRDFAEAARHALRNRDVLARFGGEEFVLLLPRTSFEQAEEICERVRSAIAANVTETAAGPVRVTVSGGLAALGPGGLAVALKRADEALYAAKRAGRDQLSRAA